MPWAGYPRINLQERGAGRETYQVRQLLTAVERVSKETDDG
jgi:hypothetical protein